ncbi:GNAT family N-acetyltransferase [Ponticaulis sp.]|uniref:GNAT family N-acetyltransferase n=1 Tax=Ponticaulis sp. TaxID=2020902 RepID=UPI000C5D12C6|nr:GNAT family N-acetyltransferase [Ponticaulis sp.]MAF56948.1 GNAT family N-acetyltransferase [Ponticaulis sp.]MBN05653.1 GNAT family N-acetyltransferase [Ponticaulis sp.]
MIIRPFRAEDFDAVYKINAASTPGVSEETPDDLRTIVGLGTCLIAEGDDGQVLGFLNLIPPGTTAYKSLNLRWFEAWLETNPVKLNYVDRIALTPEARGKGVGPQLYKAAFEHSEGCDAIGCEVNTAPDNPGSHRFHKRLGFAEVGRQAFSPEKAVAYYVLNMPDA